MTTTPRGYGAGSDCQLLRCMSLLWHFSEVAIEWGNVRFWRHSGSPQHRLLALIMLSEVIPLISRVMSTALRIHLCCSGTRCVLPDLRPPTQLLLTRSAMIIKCLPSTRLCAICGPSPARSARGRKIHLPARTRLRKQSASAAAVPVRRLSPKPCELLLRQLRFVMDRGQYLSAKARRDLSRAELFCGWGAPGLTHGRCDRLELRFKNAVAIVLAIEPHQRAVRYFDALNDAHVTADFVPYFIADVNNLHFPLLLQHKRSTRGWCAPSARA
jgi:hypothetical protein